MSSIIEKLEEHADIPRSVVLKIEFQRVGVAFAPAAINAIKDMRLNFKGEFMFSYDTVERKTLRHKIPMIYYFKRDDTIFQTKTTDESPYIVDYIDNKFFIREGEQLLEEVYFQEEPLYYSLKTSDGIPMSNVAQLLSHALFITVVKHCEFWNKN